MAEKMASEQVRRYYEETDPIKRRAILEESLKNEEDPETNRIRMELWNCRYSQVIDRRSGARADGFMKLWMTLKFFAARRSGSFSLRRNQKEIRTLLNTLGFDKMKEYGENGEDLLFWECWHAARVYMISCTQDRKYGSGLLGLMAISKEKVQQKIAADTISVSQTIPKELQLTKELSIFGKATIQAYKDLFPEDRNFLKQID